jgi:Zn-dependent peptidase ImmA (M78 family)
LIELNSLYDIADNCGINVDCFETVNAESFSVFNKNLSVIVFNPLFLNSTNDERVKLAHEVGHFKTGAFYNMYSSADIREKHEHRANKWAIKKLVPKNELIKAYKSGIYDNSELAEHFGVTEEFLQKVLIYYTNEII